MEENPDLPFPCAKEATRTILNMVLAQLDTLRAAEDYYTSKGLTPESTPRFASVKELLAKTEANCKKMQAEYERQHKICLCPECETNRSVEDP